MVSELYVEAVVMGFTEDPLVAIPTHSTYLLTAVLAQDLFL